MSSKQTQQWDKNHVQVVEEHGIEGAASSAQHKTGHFTKVCCSKTPQHGSGQTQASANAIQGYQQQDIQGTVQMYALTQTRRNPASTIEVQVSFSTGTKGITV